jgi:hypothetical protein
MTQTVIIHLVGEDPVMGELERAPEPTDTFLTVANLRKRDGKDLHFLAPGVQTVLFPFSRITFVEFMAETKDRDSVIDFFRLD